MKTKILLASLAAIALASCSDDEMIVENELENSAIGFSTYVDNASRATETTYESLTKFKVWATKTLNGQTAKAFTTILSGVDVTQKPGLDEWTYSPKKYWVKDNSYSFTGIGSATGRADQYYTFTLPSSVQSGDYLGKYNGFLTFDNQSCKATEDLVWASTKINKVVTNPGVVKFNFKHLLSRVNFKFVNARSIDAETEIEIKNVHMITAATGDLDFSAISVSTSSKDFKWVPSQTNSQREATGVFDCSYNFTSGSSSVPSMKIPTNGIAYSENKFIIPNQDIITVSFDVYTSVTGDDFINITREIDFNSVVTNEAFKDITLKPGYSYTLVAYIDNTLDNIGEIVLGVESVEPYTDAITNPFLFDVNFGAAPQFEYYYDTDINTLEAQPVSVTSVVLNKYGELVYYGNNPKTFIPQDYTYTWTIDPANGAVSFVDGTYTKTFAANSITNVSQLTTNVKYIGDCTAHAAVPVTLTITDKNDVVVVQESINVSLTLKEYGSTTGGSLDGDDNDG